MTNSNSTETTPGTSFMDRLHHEEAQLSGKIDALELFIQSGMRDVESTAHRAMLTMQLQAMKVYHHILHMRITDLQTKVL